jgi:competence protein ComGF
MINYNQSGCVKKSYEIVSELENEGKKIDWAMVDKKISKITFTPEEMNYEKKVTTLSISEELKTYLCVNLKAQLCEIYKTKRFYASTALNFLLAAGYLKYVLGEKIELDAE